MSLDIHGRAELLTGQGDRYAVEGKEEAAAAAYRAAAVEEVRAFQLIPTDRVRTRGVIAVSAVSLYRKAHALQDAIRQAYAFLALNDLPDWAQADLEDLLDDLRARRAAQLTDRILADDAFEWVLNGPKVGTGDARLATVVQKIEQVSKYGTRVYEYLAGVPVRKGPVDPRLQQAFEMRVTQPAAGSFRFLVRFSLPTGQLRLFEDQKPVAPASVGPLFAAVLDAASYPESNALGGLVTDLQYQDAFLRLVRSLAPDGKELSRVEINGRGVVASSTMLTPPVASAIGSELARRRPPQKQESERHDVLRGLNLNEDWILLGNKGQEQKCYVAEGVILADVVEGLIDRPVRVSGHWARGRFVIDDLEPEAIDEDESKAVAGRE